MRICWKLQSHDANYIINIVNDKDKLLEVSNNCYRDLYKNWDDTIEFVYNRYLELINEKKNKVMKMIKNS